MPKRYYRNFDKPLSIGSSNFRKILSFYLFECPTPNTSARTRTFNELGWNKSKQFAQLKKKMLDASLGNLRQNYYPCKKDELAEKFETVRTVKPVNEYCVFLKFDEKNVMQSLYSAIRNAFAHGSFSIQSFNGIKVYFFANFDGYLKAEIVLREDTLLKWIEIIKKGYQE